VEGAVPVEEGGVGDGAEPRLAGEGRAEEPLGLVRREAEEDLGDDVVDQLPWRRRHGVESVVGGANRLGAEDWGFLERGIRRLEKEAELVRPSSGVRT